MLCSSTHRCGRRMNDRFAGVSCQAAPINAHDRLQLKAGTVEPFFVPDVVDTKTVQLIIFRSKTVGRCRSSPSGPTIFYEIQ